MNKSLLFTLLMGAAVFLPASIKAGGATVMPPDVDYYTCAMHPSVKLMDPKAKCPICSMDLLPVMKREAAALEDTNSGTGHHHADGVRKTGASSVVVADAPGMFTVAVERQQQIGVTYGKVEQRALRHTVRTAGLVAYDKQRHWDYVARVEGYVNKLFVFSPGELVEKDAPLLTIYSPDLFTTENEFTDLLKARDDAQAKGGAAVLDSSNRLLDSARQRLRLWNVTEEQIAELEQTRKPQESLTLRSPFKGVVQDIAVGQGGKVMNGGQLVEVVDLSVVWVWAQFYQDELPMLKMGLPVTIATSAYPGEKFHGKISVVNPFLNDTLRTVRVRIDVENPDFKLRPDMYVDAELTMDMGRGLAVPVSAVLPTGKHDIVFLDKGAGKLEPRFIGLGRKYGEFYEVKSGLKEQDRVVTSANFLIDAEAKIQGALKSW